MRSIVLLLLAVPLCALAQRSPSCDSAPAAGYPCFEKSRVYPIEGDFLTGSNEVASREKGYAGPYRKGYLYDLLVDKASHRVNVVFQTEDKQRKLTFLVTRQ